MYKAVFCFPVKEAILWEQSPRQKICQLPLGIANAMGTHTHKYQETCAVGGFLGLLKHALQKAFYSLNFLSASLRQTKPHRKFPIKKVVT